MAYYPYQPYPYQDQLSQLRSAPMQAQTFQPPIYKQDNSGFQWVQGEAAAKSWFVAPGATVLLMDSEVMRFYIKSADMNGVPNMRTFEYKEVADKPIQAQETPKFVSVDVFEDFKKSVSEKLEALTAPVKPSTKKKEVTEDE